MKRLLFLLMAAAVLAAFSGCGGSPNSDSGPGSSGESSGPDAETAAELLQVLDDFRVYYNGFYEKAAAPSDEEFYGGPGLLLVTREDEADTVRFLEERALESGDGELPSLCGDLAATYAEIHAFPADTKQEEYADFCARLYAQMERLAGYLGESMPEEVLPLPEPETVSAPESAIESAGEPSAAEPGNGETIPDSRWDSDDGYTLIFYNGQAYLGTTFESDETILSEGQAATYEIQEGTIRFQAVGDPRTAAFSYDGSTMTDTNGEMFELGSTFTESYGLA